jgi:cell division protein ZapA
MAQVTVQIDGKAYRMACEEGQEGHLSDLAAKFDRYVLHLKSQFGEIGDLRITVMAGIMVMDELSEMTRKLKGAEAELEKLNSSRESMLAASNKSDTLLVAALGELTGQISGIAAKLNGGVE